MLSIEPIFRASQKVIILVRTLVNSVLPLSLNISFRSPIKLPRVLRWAFFIILYEQHYFTEKKPFTFFT